MANNCPVISDVLNQRNKTVKQYETKSEHCHVKILDKYLEALPHDAIKWSDTFYLQPNSNVSNESSVSWFKNTPVGRNTLSTTIKKMCESAGITGGNTNHTLRAFDITTMFHARVPEKLIQQRNVHCSLEYCIAENFGGRKLWQIGEENCGEYKPSP